MQSKNVWQLSKKRKHLTRNDMSCGCSAMFFIFSRFSHFLSTKNSKEKKQKCGGKYAGQAERSKMCQVRSSRVVSGRAGSHRAVKVYRFLPPKMEGKNARAPRMQTHKMHSKNARAPKMQRV